jgi:hypothetical protein
MYLYICTSKVVMTREIRYLARFFLEGESAE